MTEKEIKIINNYLLEVVKNSYKCQHCSMCHNNNICLFAYNCIKKDFYDYKKKNKKIFFFFIKTY